MNRRILTIALIALVLAGCIKVNPTSTDVENLPAELDADTVLYTQGTARSPAPCFASLTISTDGGETIANYQEFTGPGSYIVPLTFDDHLVTEFNTQGCQPWTLEP